MATILTLPNNALPFETHSELQTWLEAERAKWNWVSNQAPNEGAFNTMNRIFNQLIDEIVQQANNNQPLHMVTSIIESRFTSGPLVYSQSDEGERILGIRDREGIEAGAAAFGFYRQGFSLGEVRSMQHLRGVMSFAFPSSAPVEELIKSIVAERSKLRRTATELNTEAAKAEAGRESRARNALTRAIQIFRKSQSRMRVRRAELMLEQDTSFLNWEKQVSAALESFVATEATYKEQMALQAPVTYWTEKAQEHKRQEQSLKLWVIGYFIVTIPTVVTAFGVTGGWLLGIPAGGGKVDSALYVVAGAGLAAVTTLVLWAGRLLTRFYLSQNHLHHDANDRATMTKTYLALTAAKAAEEKDRAIILAALFRPSTDGIVKDDGAPDLGVAGVASKVLTGGRS